MSTCCYICEESYTRTLNPPVTLTPCGHCACQPCITSWQKSKNSCPECRQPIQKVVQNRSLMNLIEEQQKNKRANDEANKATTTTSSSSCHVMDTARPATSKNRQKEVLLDKCEYAVYIIDNSQSMEYYHDGKIFECEHNGPIRKQRGVMRWHEACSKIRQIAKYNLQREVCCSYFLLNPNTRKKNLSDWTENVDFVTFDPLHEDVSTLNQKYEILITQLLSAGNIRGSTPLDEITRYFGRNLSKFIGDDERFAHKPICYNVITDGQPNSKTAFERELKYLADHYNIFLTINLCTDDDDIVSYYNELDRKIGKELSGMDVIDDLEAEQREVIEAGNTFFVYSAALHVCRMAGCYSVVADLMDEERMLTHHANKLCNELCGVSQNEDAGAARNRNRDERPNCYERKNYVRFIRGLVKAKPNVYDFKSKQMKPIIDVDKLDTLLWMNEPSNDAIEKLQKWLTKLNQRGLLLYAVIGVVVVLVLLKAIST
mmetsp:Transcript_36971/g.60833  ORF Transcript_36971/g.60833 Transcript_36971/m.60833 type:complete len:487 (-) Transcript_36971:253-1713(-)